MASNNISTYTISYIDNSSKKTDLNFQTTNYQDEQTFVQEQVISSDVEQKPSYGCPQKIKTLSMGMKKEKKKVSDLVLCQKPLYQQKCLTGKVTTQ